MNESSSVNSHSVKNLINQLENSTTQTQKNIKSTGGKFEIWSSDRKGKMPEWASNHIEIHNQLKMAVIDMEYKGAGDSEIFAKAIHELGESDKVILKLANKVNSAAYYALKQSDAPRIDKDGLLTSSSGVSIKKTLYEWQLNLGLLMNVYNKTQDPEMKKKVEFLALNYLAKAAPIDLKELKIDQKTMEQFTEMFQLGGFQKATYHREAPVFDGYIAKQVTEFFVNSPSVGSHVLTDSTEFQHLLPLLFKVMETPHTESIKNSVGGWSDNLFDAMVDHFNVNPEDPFNEYIDPPLMLDLTEFLSEDIKRNSIKENTFDLKIKNLEINCEKAIDNAVEKIKKEHPNLCKTPEDEQKIKAFLKFNVSCMCRSEVNGIGVLKNVQIFLNPKNYELPKGVETFLKLPVNDYFIKTVIEDKFGRTSRDFTALVNYSGIRLGGINGREKIFIPMILQDLAKRC